MLSSSPIQQPTGYHVHPECRKSGFKSLLSLWGFDPICSTSLGILLPWHYVVKGRECTTNINSFVSSRSKNDLFIQQSICSMILREMKTYSFLSRIWLEKDYSIGQGYRLWLVEAYSNFWEAGQSVPSLHRPALKKYLTMSSNFPSNRCNPQYP